eukprot:350073-Chlamydomonas_euryale.AAC.8
MAVHEPIYSMRGLPRGRRSRAAGFRHRTRSNELAGATPDGHGSPIVFPHINSEFLPTRPVHFFVALVPPQDEARRCAAPPLYL